MTTGLWLALGAGAAGLAALFVLPRLLIARAQDRLARETMAREAAALKLLTRADLVIGRYRRIPGLLWWKDDGLAFHGLSGHHVRIPSEGILKIVTADRLASGRLLRRLEALRLTRSGGEELEFVVAPKTAAAWRRLLGEWAGREG